MNHITPLVGIYWESTRPTRFFAILASLIAAVGIYLKSDNMLDDHTLINSIMPWYYWVSILLFTSMVRLYVLMVPEERCKKGEVCLYARSLLCMLTGVMGIVVWSVMLVSSVAAYTAGTNLIFGVFCAMEVWLLSRALITYRYSLNVLKRR